MRRRRAREFALQILFSLENQLGEQIENASEGVPIVVEEYLKNFAPREASENADVAYLNRLLQGILKNRASLDEKIERFSDNWKLYRMTKIDRNVLRIGAGELSDFDDVPPKVTIDECVELAKRFGTDDSSAFVNGILDKLRQSLGKQEA